MQYSLCRICAGGKGNGQMLKEYGKKHGFRTVIVPEVVIDGETVSSTRIRRLAGGKCWTGSRKPASALYPAQMKLRYEKLL